VRNFGAPYPFHPFLALRLLRQQLLLVGHISAGELGRRVPRRVRTVSRETILLTASPGRLTAASPSGRETPAD
jgi:hypothetical protein